jgi:hypothetical protein
VLEAKDLRKYGDWSYIGAWILELIAATIGLSIALLIVVQGLSEGASWAFLGPMVGAAVLVSFAELTKIPLATALFAVDLVKKPFFLLALGLMALITFETIFFGLEQSQVVRQLSYQKVAGDLAKVRSEINLLESGGALESLSSDRAEAEASIQSLEAQLASIEELRQSRKASVMMNQLPNELAAELENLQRESERLAIDLEDAKVEFDAWKAERQGRYDDQKRSWEEQIKNYLAQDMKTEALDIQKKLDNIAHPRTKPDWKARLAQFDKLQVEMRGKIDKATERIEQIIIAARTDQNVIDRLNKVDQDINEQRDQTQDQIRKARDQLLQIQDSQNAALSESRDNNAKLSDLRQEEVQLETERRRQAQLDQIRRLATLEIFSGQKDLAPEDVSESAMKKVASFWFGTLALLAALAGPFTAITSLTLKNLAKREEQKSLNALGKPIRHRGVVAQLFLSIRYLIVHWRWRRIETRIKEREVVVPKYHYVPVPADDPQEIWDFLENTDVPVEVKEQVEARMIGLLRQSSAGRNETEVETGQQEIPESSEQQSPADPEEIESLGSDAITQSPGDDSPGDGEPDEPIRDSLPADDLGEISASQDESASDSSSVDISESKPGDADETSESKS